MRSDHDNKQHNHHNAGTNDHDAATNDHDRAGATTTTESPAENCDSSYPDFCIPPPSPDLDCGDINGTNFTVVGSDPHGFDGNDDGIGCES